MHLRPAIDELKIMYKNLQSLHKYFANMKLMKYPYLPQGTESNNNS